MQRLSHRLRCERVRPLQGRRGSWRPMAAPVRFTYLVHSLQ